MNPAPPVTRTRMIASLRCVGGRVGLGAGEALGGGVRAATVLGEAALGFGDGIGEGEQVPGDELVVVVGTDGVPVHPVGGDRDFGDEGLGGQHDAGVSGAAPRDGSYE